MYMQDYAKGAGEMKQNIEWDMHRIKRFIHFVTVRGGVVKSYTHYLTGQVTFDIIGNVNTHRLMQEFIQNERKNS